MPDDAPQPLLAPTRPVRRAVLALLVGERVRLYAYARFLVVVLMLIAGPFAVHVVGVRGLDQTALLWLALAVTLYNAVVLALASGPGETEDSPGAVRRLQHLLAASVVLDFVALTVAVWIVGGARSPLLAFYLFHLVVSAFLLPRRSALLAAALAIALLATLVLSELSGVVPAHNPVGAIPAGDPLTPTYALTVLAVYSTLFVLISISATGLVARLRRAQEASRQKSLELEKLSAMRREFLLLALHNMNSPLGVVSMLLRNLRTGLLGGLDPAQEEQLDRALRKLDGLEGFLAELRTLSELDRADLHEHSTEVSLSFLLADVVDAHQDLAQTKHQTLRFEPGEQTGLVFGIPRLLREALANYVTNAIKYTPEGGSITARVTSHADRVRAEVSDTGVGIAPADTPRLFHEFVRVGRTNPETKREKGTGLGLALVKRIAHAHAGAVGVDSTPGTGSTFWLELPACGSPGSPPAPTSTLHAPR